MVLLPLKINVMIKASIHLVQFIKFLYGFSGVIDI